MSIDAYVFGCWIKLIPHRWNAIIASLLSPLYLPCSYSKISPIWLRHLREPQMDAKMKHCSTLNWRRVIVHICIQILSVNSHTGILSIRSWVIILILINFPLQIITHHHHTAMSTHVIMCSILFLMLFIHVGSFYGIIIWCNVNEHIIIIMMS